MTTSEAETIEPARRFDTSRARSVGSAVAISFLVPLVLFVVVRPDWYYVQNGLDPFFYTGYAQNFTEIFYAAGAEHYFISRWTIYLPQRALLALFDDPTAAFLLFRWAGAALIVASVLALGRRRWRRADAVALVALCLVMPKGSRLIAASLLDPSPEASSHLVSGPAVLMEYRNRGIGSRLLHASLEALRGNGITVASGITRAKTMAARHVYPKFGGVAESVTFSKPVEAKS